MESTINLFVIIYFAALIIIAFLALVVFAKADIKRKRKRKNRVTEIKRSNGITRVTEDENGNIIKVSNIKYL